MRGATPRRRRLLAAFAMLAAVLGSFACGGSGTSSPPPSEAVQATTQAPGPPPIAASPSAAPTSPSPNLATPAAATPAPRPTPPPAATPVATPAPLTPDAALAVARTYLDALVSGDSATQRALTTGNAVPLPEWAGGTGDGTKLEDVITAEPYLESTARIAVPVRLTEVKPDSSRAVVAGTLVVSQSSGSPKIVDQYVAELPTPAAAPPPCRAADLDGTALAQGATGSIAGSVILTNKGTADCSLQGRPNMVLLDGNNQLLPTDESDLPDQRNPNQLVTLAPGHRAVARYSWSNLCAAGTQAGANAAPVNGVTALVILPVSGDALRVPVDQSASPGAVPSCDDPAQHAQLAVSSFNPFQAEH